MNDIKHRIGSTAAPVASLEGLVDYADRALIDGVEDTVVVERLCRGGLNRVLARDLVGQLRKRHALASGHRRQGVRQMLAGAALAAAGGIVGLAASGAAVGGDSHAVMTGLLGVGIVSFFLGLFQASAP